MITAVIVIIGLSVLILGHEAGHFFAAKAFRLKIDEFGFGFPPRIKVWRSVRKWREKDGTLRQAQGDTAYSVNWLPFGGFVKIAGEEDQVLNPGKLEALTPEEKKRYFLFQRAWKRSVVIGAGVLVNFVIGWLLLSSVLMAGAPGVLIIDGVQAGSPAEKAGIMNGDIIRGYSSSEGLKDYIDANRGKGITFDILRNGKEINISAVPRVSPPRGEGALGISFSEGGIKKHGPVSALVEGFKEAVDVSVMTLAAFYSLVKNLIIHGSLLAGVVGPVGIFSVAEKTGQVGLMYLVQLIAFISLNLAVVNLLPFPALDGGRLFLIALEKLKGSPVSLKTQAIVNGAGFAFLIFLMLIVTIRDVAGLF